MAWGWHMISNTIWILRYRLSFLGVETSFEPRQKTDKISNRVKSKKYETRNKWDMKQSGDLYWWDKGQKSKDTVAMHWLVDTKWHHF